MKYADRIMHGTDLIVMSAWETPGEVDKWAGDTSRYNASIFQFYETSDEIPPTEPRLRNWLLTGIDLPDDILRKIYYDNARRIIPGL
jgi:hypothetical protein